MTRKPPRPPVLAVADRSIAYRAPAGSIEHLIEVLGNNRVAELLGVSASQPSRWRRGLERIGDANLRRVLDLDYAVARLLLLYPPRQAAIWLESSNAHLLGARPIDVLRLRGARAVIEAIDAETEGAFV